jgi:hypothetical protein
MQTNNESHGQCFCGRVQIRVLEALHPPINCHCGQCRRMNGSAFTTWLSIPRDAMLISGEYALSTHHPTDNITRRFCKFCGTHVWTLDRRQPAIAGLLAGFFEGLELTAPKAEYFVSHKAKWFDMPKGSKCFGGETGFEPVQI